MAITVVEYMYMPVPESGIPPSAIEPKRISCLKAVELSLPCDFCCY